MTSTDLFPYMESYTLVLGSILVVASGRLGWDDKVAYLALITMALDVCETLVQRRGVLAYPEQLWWWTIAMGKLCNMAKWACFTSSICVVAISFVFGRHEIKHRRTRTRHHYSSASPPVSPSKVTVG
jgi:hypothetical protein